MRSTLLLAVTASAALGCASQGRSAGGEAAGAEGSRVGPPGTVALAPLGEAVTCGADTADSDARAQGSRRRLDVRDRPRSRGRWERRVALELDSAGRPLRLRVFASTPGALAASQPARDTVDFAQAWFAGDGRVERGVVARTGGRRGATTIREIRCRARCTRRPRAWRWRSATGVRADA